MIDPIQSQTPCSETSATPSAPAASPLSRRSFLYAAVAAGVTGKAAMADRIHVVEESQREFEFEGCPATEFIVRPDTVGSFGNATGGAVELVEAVGGQSFLVPLFDLTKMTEAKSEENLNTSVKVHGNWHGDQGRSAPPIHIHLIRVTGYPNLRALLVHPKRCVLEA